MSDDQSAKSGQRYRRVAVRVGVRISTIDPEADPETGAPYFRTTEETCANVSRGQRPLLELPSGEPVQTVARVAWTRTQIQSADASARPGGGIEFLDGSPEELRRLEEFLDGVSPSQPGGSPTRA